MAGKVEYKFTLTEETEDDEIEVEHTVPGKFAVCDDCEGHGTVLNEAIRNHCYSAEEFYREFDEEEREEYFKRGGRYDVQCPTCKGKNVVITPNFAGFSEEQKELWKKFQEREERLEALDREMEFERRMGA